MLFTYGQGTYLEESKRVDGEVVLSELKLYLKGPEGDYAQTYVPLDRVEKIRKGSGGLEVFIRQTTFHQYVAVIQLDKKNLEELIKDIVQFRGFKKQFLKSEWTEDLS